MNNKFKNLKLFISTLIIFCMISVPSLALDAINMTVGEFDYDALSVNISGKLAQSGEQTGALYIIPSDGDINALCDGNLPLFVDIITTASDGAFDFDVSFLSSGTPFTYGTYDVYLYYKDASTPPLEGTFEYLTEQQKIDRKKAAVLKTIKDSRTWQGMRDALGLKEDGSPIPSDGTFAFIDSELTIDTSDYDVLNDYDKFFMALYEAKANIQTFSSIKTEFERIASLRKTADYQTPTVPPASGNSSVGGGSPSIKTDPPANNPAAGGQTASFTDMAGHWAELYVNTLAKNGVINGYEDGSFGPDNSVTRAELVKIIASAFGLGTGGTGNYYDVSPSDWFAPYVYSASAAGIVTGFDGLFNPNTPVSRQDAAVMIFRAISRTHPLGMGYKFFADETSIASYAVENVSALAEIGIITGNENNHFMPLSSLSRGEAAALISRASDYILAH